jgi:hypothetical protein
MNLARLRALHAALRALEVDATTIPYGPGLGLSGSGRAQRPGQTAFVPVTRPVAELGGPPAFGVIAGDAYRSVDEGSVSLAQVREALRQARRLRRPVCHPSQQRVDQARAARPW